MISEGRSIASISAVLADQYEVSIAQAQSDVQRVVAELLEEKLVLLADGARRP